MQPWKRRKRRRRSRLAHTSWFEVRHPLALSRGSQTIECSNPSSATVSEARTITFAPHSCLIYPYAEQQSKCRIKGSHRDPSFLRKTVSAGPARRTTVPFHPRTHLYSDAQGIVSTKKWLWRARPFTYAVAEEAGLVRVLSARSSGIWPIGLEQYTRILMRSRLKALCRMGSQR